MSNTTTHSFWGGRLYTEYWTAEMMRRIRAAKAAHGFAVVAGGAGAWQFAAEPEQARDLGFDCIFEGPFESGGPELVAAAMAGRQLPAHVKAQAAGELVRPIKGPSMLGVIELSRGCGKGCRFCTAGGQRMTHLPKELILADLATNVAGGRRCAVSSSEDFFRYGGAGPRVNFEALRDLLESMCQVQGLSFMQIDHANVSSVLQLEPGQLREIRRLLEWERPTEYLWVNLGVESAERFARAGERTRQGGAVPRGGLGGNGSAGRRAAGRDGVLRRVQCHSRTAGRDGGGCSADAAAGRMAIAQKVGGVSDLPRTGGLRRTWRGEAFSTAKMLSEHLELYTACYELNFRRVPSLYWDNQRAGGVGLARRLAIQMLGKVEVRAWRKNFAKAREKLRKTTS